MNNDDKAMIDEHQSDSEDYSYSEESLCSDDTLSHDSDEVTNVTLRSSVSSSVMSSQNIEKSSNPSRSESKMSSNGGRSCLSVNDLSTGQRVSRRNMSFTNLEMMRIERENQYLLKKIMAQQRPPTHQPVQLHTKSNRLSSSAINRRKFQRRIEEENMMMLRKIQSAKSCVLSNRNTPGYRLTSL